MTLILSWQPTFEKITRVIADFEEYRKKYSAKKEAKYYFILYLQQKYARANQLIDTKKYQKEDQDYSESEQWDCFDKEFSKLTELERRREKLGKNLWNL